MCPHEWKRIGDCKVCMRCGIMKLPNGQYVFDRDFPNYEPERKTKKAVKKDNAEN